MGKIAVVGIEPTYGHTGGGFDFAGFFFTERFADRYCGRHCTPSCGVFQSQEWGNAKDIEPYVDPVFENNVLLTATERLMMSGRPKQPKYARNKNILVIGGSGSGKTRFFVKPNLMQMHSSYVVTDPKG